MTLSMQAAAALARIARVSGVRAEPQTLMPAEVILELSGEIVRSRLCTFTDASGKEHCLRPDLTTPIAQMVASSELPVARYHGAGPVYRLPPRGSNDPVEHLQIGFEWFGNGGSPSEDAEALAVALEAAQAGGATGAQVRFGDVAIYRAVLAALSFSPQWSDRLRRAFSRRKGPQELLADASRSPSADAGEVGRLGLLPSKEAALGVVAELKRLGVEPVGRSVDDIAARLRDKAADVAPAASVSAALIKYLDISVSMPASLGALQAFAREQGLDISAALDAFAERLAHIAKLKPPFWSEAVFSAQAGRRFEYYDGFVFELAREGAADRPIVSGGRYDGLIARLSGGTRDASAIGAALRADRLGEGSRA
ncbi:MAG TPA: ATP phosphoribosyltransferase regulatory subunit [Hyphomonadaceae bacterium]|nr:ATP phosphoribosyltransferase regulatory subunit [Hyphomonadaceae bacterium]HPI49195.1 ATP phosphoribosyltransferase regulatory subunit [Hyphomonadaceae bacterium]